MKITLEFDSFEDAEAPLVKAVLGTMSGGAATPEPAPKKAEAAPKKAEAAPKKAEAAPKKAEAAPKKAEAAPKKAEAAPKKAEAAPKKAEAAPKKAEAAPKKEEAAPKKAEAAPAEESKEVQEAGLMETAIELASKLMSEGNVRELRNQLSQVGASRVKSMDNEQLRLFIAAVENLDA